MGFFDFLKPNVEKMERKGDVLGLMRVLRGWESHSFDVQRGAVEALARIGEPAVEALVEALRDEDRFVRCHAADALRRIGDARSVQPLVQALKDEYEIVRLYAMEGLGRVGDAAAVEPLIRVLNDEFREVPYESLRKHVVEALAGVGEPAVEPLIEALKDEDVRVREAVAEALGGIGDERAADPLVHALEDGHWSVRRRAADALAGIRGTAAEPAIRSARAEGVSLIKVYAVLFRRDISAQEYAERARLVFGYSPGARVVGTPPSDETFAGNAIREVCGDIWSMSPVPEVKVERDDPMHFVNEPKPGGGMNEYATSFLRRKISEGEDPDYFHLSEYVIHVDTSLDLITRDGALIIRISLR